MREWENQATELVENLRTDARVSLYDIGFFEGTLNNDTVGEKIGGSYAGNAADVAIRAVASKLVLFVCRCTENNGDSIPRFIELVRGKGPEIEAKRKARRPDMPDGFLEIGRVNDTIEALANELEELKSAPSMHWIRVHREERLGHSLRLKGGTRRRFLSSEMNESELNYTHLLDAANETARLSFEAIRIWTFTVENPRSTIKIIRDNTKSFWDCLPVLKDVER